MRSVLLLAYARTAYQAGGAAFRVGQRCPALDRLLAEHASRTATFVTAFNPYSRRMPDGWNHRMQARLLSAVQGRTWVAGQGIWRGWSEAHVVLFGDPRPVIRLARLFRQNAVLVIRRGQKVRLAWVAARA
jgi:hypothetical protein